MDRPEPTPEKLRALWDRVAKYVDEVQLSCYEAYCQNDKAQLETFELVPDIAEIVGFYKYPEDD